MKVSVAGILYALCLIGSSSCSLSISNNMECESSSANFRCNVDTECGLIGLVYSEVQIRGSLLDHENGNRWNFSNGNGYVNMSGLSKVTLVCEVTLICDGHHTRVQRTMNVSAENCPGEVRLRGPPIDHNLS